jgi:hypothetical protein
MTPFKSQNLFGEERIINNKKLGKLNPSFFDVHVQYSLIK